MAIRGEELCPKRQRPDVRAWHSSGALLSRRVIHNSLHDGGALALAALDAVFDGPTKC